MRLTGTLVRFLRQLFAWEGRVFLGDKNWSFAKSKSVETLRHAYGLGRSAEPGWSMFGRLQVRLENSEKLIVTHRRAMLAGLLFVGRSFRGRLLADGHASRIEGIYGLGGFPRVFFFVWLNLILAISLLLIPSALVLAAALLVMTPTDLAGLFQAAVLIVGPTLLLLATPSFFRLLFLFGTGHERQVYAFLDQAS